jgi:hypothetical protein
MTRRRMPRCSRWATRAGMLSAGCWTGLGRSLLSIFHVTQDRPRS